MLSFGERRFEGNLSKWRLNCGAVLLTKTICSVDEPNFALHSYHWNPGPVGYNDIPQYSWSSDFRSKDFKLKIDRFNESGMNALDQIFEYMEMDFPTLPSKIMISSPGVLKLSSHELLRMRSAAAEFVCCDNQRSPRAECRYQGVFDSLDLIY